MAGLTPEYGYKTKLTSTLRNYYHFFISSFNHKRKIVLQRKSGYAIDKSAPVSSPVLCVLN